MKITKLDALFSRYVRLLADGRCGKCGKHVGYENLATAHFYGRIRHTVRWDIRNVVALCNPCHYWLDVNPLAKSSFMYEVLSKEEIRELNRIANLTTKDYPIDKEALVKKFREGIKRLWEE
uniref:Uncharacterized protein n=1 Tax=viral metagenome TaxID=1070528 RepID=A0A6M3K5E1_9ZZZZ